MIKKKILILCGIAILAVTGCRGYESSKPAIHPNPNMDWQSKYKAQTLPLLQEEGTIPWGENSVSLSKQNRERYLPTDTKVYQGKDANGQFVSRVPIAVSEKTLLRGQERFDIYCAACHDKAGTGKGSVVERGMIPPPNFSDDRILNYSDGAIFDVITNGIRTMPAYAKQISVEDRWAIVTYVRALQKSRSTHFDEIKDRVKGTIR